MTQHAHLDPSAFFLEGGKTGVLLIHGYTGSPTEMRWIGDYLHARGLTVSGPLLPGHGTTPEAMNRCRWTDWTGHVEAALADLRCTLHAGVRRRAFDGFAAHAPPGGEISRSPRGDRLFPCRLDRHFEDLPDPYWLRHFVAFQPKSADSDLMDPQANRQLWCYDVDPVGAAAELLKLILDVRRSLPKVVCPVIIIHSTRDAAIHPASAQRTFERIGAPDKQLITLHESGHCITVDRQWEYVAERTYNFIVGHGG